MFLGRVPSIRGKGRKDPIGEGPQSISFCLVVHHGCPHRHPTERHVRIGSEVEVLVLMP